MLRSDVIAGEAPEVEMLDRQKLEAILTHRFPTAATAQLAAAANAIIGLADDRAAESATRTDGPRRPITTIAVSAEIDAPVYRVFDVFTDIERAPERVSSIKHVEMLTPGGFALGARWRETRDVFGRLDTAEIEVIGFEQDRAFALSHSRAGVAIEIVFSFEAEDTGTRVTIEFTLDGPGMPPGFLTPLSWAIAGKVRHALSHDLTELKDDLEGRDRARRHQR